MNCETPEFKSEAEEFELWSNIELGADSTAYLDWSKEKRVKFTNLRPTLKRDLPSREE
jgi:hypothetical protein